MQVLLLTMTLINTAEFHALANTIGTIVFLLTLIWAIWFASRMD
ncbi:MAG: delta-aminolevulinic acid dehydratase [Xenococcaceae cyanobacterium MO_188.B19]|nr:delta-aminolevulinic acid dehydratase [Xenococcaceae cyanobacterium MO_188.B19]